MPHINFQYIYIYILAGSSVGRFCEKLVTSYFVMAGAGDLAERWEQNTIIRRRLQRGVPFVQWPIPMRESENDEDKELHPICTKAVELNCQALIEMVEHFNGCFSDVVQLEHEAGGVMSRSVSEHAHVLRSMLASRAAQVVKLYKLCSYQPKKKESYTAVWDLRRLYTYSFRRQLDAFKRNQVPRDWGIKNCVSAASYFGVHYIIIIYIILEKESISRLHGLLHVSPDRTRVFKLSSSSLRSIERNGRTKCSSGSRTRPMVLMIHRLRAFMTWIAI